MKRKRSKLARQLVKFVLKIAVRIVIPLLIMACDHLSKSLFGKPINEAPC